MCTPFSRMPDGYAARRERSKTPSANPRAPRSRPVSIEVGPDGKRRLFPVGGESCLSKYHVGSPVPLFHTKLHST